MIAPHVRALVRTRATLGFALACTAIPLATVAVNVWIGDLPDPATTRDVLGGSGTIAVLALAFGAASAASEVQHGTARALAVVSRRRIRPTAEAAAALAVTAAAIALVAGLLCVAAGAASVAVRGAAPVPPAEVLARLVAGAALSGGAAAVLGAAAGVVAGRPGVAVAGALGAVLVVEPALSAAVPALSERGLGVVFAALSGIAPRGGPGQAAAVLWVLPWLACALAAALAVARGREL